MKNNLRKAFKLANKYHKEQVDKAGKPYINHPLAVSRMVKGRKQKIVALLHDTLEDTELPLELLEKNFTEDVVRAIKILTKDEKIEYMDYIAIVDANELARQVKICDLKHNMDLTRLDTIGEIDLNRMEKYHNAYKYLTRK